MENKNLLINENLKTLKIVNDYNYSFTNPKFENNSLSIFIDNSSDGIIEFNVLESSTLNLTIISSSSKKINFKFNVLSDATLNLFSTDKLNGDVESIKDVYLNGENSILNAYVFSQTNNVNLDSTFNIHHNALNTTAESKVNLLAKGSSKLKMNVTAYIEDSMTNSNSTELIKGIILSKDSIIEAKPILVVKHDDVKANHGCAIGTIDQNEIYYLMSRGLSYDDALRIISKSLVVPIINSIKDNEFKEFVEPTINSLIGE